MTPEERVAAARAVIASHESFAKAGALDGIMTNVHPDVVVLTAGVPLLVGSEAFRDFYQELLSMGEWDFGHDYRGGNVVGDVVELFGLARGTLTLPDGAASPFENNFILQLRPGPDGALKVWRGAFAPSAP
jgi:ketosteroid isomerase-like protein